MAERKYSISEIDRMRSAVETLWLGPYGRTYHVAEKAAQVEERLRTYMANGTAPEELEAATREMYERSKKHALESE